MYDSCVLPADLDLRLEDRPAGAVAIAKAPSPVPFASIANAISAIPRPFAAQWAINAAGEGPAVT
jgi:hypothetical protein